VVLEAQGRSQRINIILDKTIEGLIDKDWQEYQDINNYLGLPKIDFSTFSTRLKIDTGFRCNAKCNYCYYISKVNNDFLDSKEITEQIDLAKKNNFKSIEFSGGESTIHPDFENFISYAKSLGLITSVITNGVFNQSKLKYMLERGLDEIMFSIHGFRETHDNIVQLPDAFESIQSNLRLINNYHKPVKSRLNIIINKKSIFDLDRIVDELLSFHKLYLIDINQINFLPINEWSDAKRIGSVQQNIIHDNIEIIERNIEKIIKIKKIDFNLRYFEYCKINERYHKYVYNYIHQYFTNDWNPFFIYKNDIKQDKYNILPLIKDKKELFNTIKKELKEKRNNKNSQYFKNKECIKCKFNIVCDGFKKV
jgi:MoaA/NifB/PqqE/SkfB family radical SAM enzyme